jgi:hypothetical protein
MTDEELLSLVGLRFPGGEYTIAEWENALLTDCTTREPMSGDLAHPIVLFHVPIQGAGTSIADLFTIGRGGGAGTVTLLSYDWEYVRPVRRNQKYRIDGGIVEANRARDDTGAVAYDDVAFSIELFDPDGELVARVTNRWRFLR